MLKDITDFENWFAPTMEELVTITLQKREVERSRAKITSWKKFSGQLSPLTTYSYLKIRFGPPNGLTIIGKKLDSADNLIHWHYSIHSGHTTIDFMGHSSGMEILLKHPSYSFTETDRESFTCDLKLQFSKYGTKVNLVKSQLEHWSLFVNPFVRLYQTIHEIADDLQNLEIVEPTDVQLTSTNDEYLLYHDQMNKWTTNITKAAALGTILRMLYPVLLESFVNLLIYKFCKKEYKADQRLYENLIRQQIDIRVKSLHLNCDEFTGAIDGEDTRFKRFHTLMNKRNDSLHGNINPKSLHLEDIYFDYIFTPLYENDEGIIKKMMSKYTIGVSLQEVLDDESVVNDFIALVLERLTQSGFEAFIRLMGERFPGINKKTNRIGILLPGHYAEGAAFVGQKIEEDSDYQWVVSSRGDFELFLPVSWSQELTNGKHYFHDISQPEGEYIVLTIKELKADDFKTRERLRNTKVKLVDNNKLYIIDSIDAIVTKINSYAILRGNTYAFFTCVVPVDNSKPKSNQHRFEEMEKMIGSFKLINPNMKEQKLCSYYYYLFIKGLATTQLLLDNARKSNAYFEIIVLLSIEIEALLRIGIVLKKQLIEKTNKIETKWIYQEKGSHLTTSNDVYEECDRLEVLERAELDRIKASSEKVKFILDNFVISPIPLWEVEAFGSLLGQTSEELNNRIRQLEDEQISLDIGMAKEFAEGDRKIFADLVKSRVGQNSHFNNLLLKTRREA